MEIIKLKASDNQLIQALKFVMHCFTMPANKSGLLKNELVPFLLLFFVMASCVKRYEPELESSDAVKFVVSGGIYKGDSVQYIHISTTSPVNSPKHIPVTGCQVKLKDDKGNEFVAVDQLNGDYSAVIPENLLSNGASFKVDILVPGGENLVSDFDQLHDSPDLNSLYYQLDSISSVDNILIIRGIQFFTNLDAENSTSRFFRWQATETWEYHAAYPIEYWYNGTLHREQPPDYSRYICWRTAVVNKFFTLTTKNQAVNKYDKFPLHFVDNVSSPRLVYGYSLVLRQYALSEAAFTYWDKIRINSHEQGGLYEKQPLAVTGNLYNLTHPDQQVLGFFEVSEVKSKRIFIRDVENLPYEYDPGCSTAGEEPRRTGLKGIPSSFYPAYLFATQYGYSIILLNNTCYDCRAAEGDTIKPAYWPD